MNLNKSRSGNDKVELQIAPLIDVVFLLLIYFIMAAQLIRKEGDIKFVLPAPPAPSTKIEIPVEAVIQIGADGVVEIDAMQFDANDVLLTSLADHLRGLRVMATAQGSKFFVNLLPDKKAVLDRIVNVMDACSAAQVESLTFSQSL
jgi:biopolymer transport protein ExbD